jgi:AcrR family transcriptional regulator
VTPRDTYHHGDLRRALLDAALPAIDEKGVDGLSLRELAAGLGVSHAAPYHHFAGKGALIAALADEAGILLDERMAAAEVQAGADARQRLVAIGMAYVTFAVERRDYYAAFTASPGTQPVVGAEPPTGSDSRGDSWRRLLASVGRCQRDGVLPEGDPVVFGVYLWALVHGLVELWHSGQLAALAQEGLEPLAQRVLTAALS